MSRKVTGVRTYAVGYGKPPPEHCFPKGKSGNPAGRPKKKSPVEPLAFVDNTLLGSSEPTRMAVLTEAYRPVRVRDGEGSTEMPGIQAAARKLLNLGLAGSRIALKDYLSLQISLGSCPRAWCKI